MGANPTRSRHCKRGAARQRSPRAVTGFAWEDRRAALIRKSGNLSIGGVLFSARKTPKEHPIPPAKPRAAISWSGGKDSCAALQRVHAQFDVVAMVTMFDEDAVRSRSHGLRPEVIAAHADRLGLTQVIGRCSWDTYNDTFSRALEKIAASGVTHVVFGDIMFEEHRRWAERMCEGSGLTAVEPLWGESTDALFDEWIASGAAALIVTARAEFLDDTWLGRTLSADMAADFVRLGVDKCGERGEYHTVVTRCPLFSHPLALRTAGAVQRSGCWALDVEVAEEHAAPGR